MFVFLVMHHTFERRCCGSFEHFVGVKYDCFVFKAPRVKDPGHVCESLLKAITSQIASLDSLFIEEQERRPLSVYFPPTRISRSLSFAWLTVGS